VVRESFVSQICYGSHTIERDAERPCANLYARRFHFHCGSTGSTQLRLFRGGLGDMVDRGQRACRAHFAALRSADRYALDGLRDEDVADPQCGIERTAEARADDGA